MLQFVKRGRGGKKKVKRGKLGSDFHWWGNRKKPRGEKGTEKRSVQQKKKRGTVKTVRKEVDTTGGGGVWGGVRRARQGRENKSFQDAKSNPAGKGGRLQHASLNWWREKRNRARWNWVVVGEKLDLN